MNKQSVLRKLKRQAMKEQGMTFAHRVTESIRTGKPIRPVKFNFEAKKLTATDAKTI